MVEVEPRGLWLDSLVPRVQLGCTLRHGSDSPRPTAGRLCGKKQSSGLHALTVGMRCRA